MESKILEKFSKIKEPETGASIVDLGMVDGIVFKDGVCHVYVNFAFLNSSCMACVPILQMVLRSIIRKMERVLREEKLSYRIIEAGRNEVYAQG